MEISPSIYNVTYIVAFVESAKAKFPENNISVIIADITLNAIFALITIIPLLSFFEKVDVPESKKNLFFIKRIGFPASAPDYLLAFAI
jgi:hypothetical protein